VVRHRRFSVAATRQTAQAFLGCGVTEFDESMTDDGDYPLCLDCGYRLDHLESERCPECGRAFDLLDPNTFTTPGRRWRPSNKVVFAAALSGIPVVATILTVCYDASASGVVVALFLAIPYATGVYAGSRGQRWVFYPSATLLTMLVFLAVVLPDYYSVIAPGADGYAGMLFSTLLGVCCCPMLLGCGR